MARWLICLLLAATIWPPEARAQVLFRIGSTGPDYGKAVAVDDHGNSYLALYFNATMDVDPGPGTSNLTSSSFVDIAFIKYDAGGNLVWVRHIRNINPTPSQSDIPHGIGLDAATNIYLTGYFSGTADFDPGPGQVLRTSFGDYDTWVASYTPDGDFRWVQSYGNTNAGNETEERNYEIFVDSEGYSYAAGFFEGSLDIAGLVSAGGQDGVVTKFDPAGNLIWAMRIGGATNDQAQAIALDESGHMYVLGAFRGTADFDPGGGTSNLTSAGNSDMFVARYTTNAILDWVFRIGGFGFEQGAPGGMAVDGGGNVYFSGRFQTTVDFDPGPGVSNLVSAGSDDLFVATYTPAGTLRWAFRVGGNGLDGGHRVKLDAQTNVYVSGWFTGNTDFDPGPGTTIISANSTNGGSDSFVAKYDHHGNFLWTTVLQPSVASTNDGIAAGMCIDRHDRVFVTGQFFSNASLTAGHQMFALTNAGVGDCFLYRLNPGGELAGVDIDEVSATSTGLSFRLLAAAGHDYTIMHSSDLTTWSTSSVFQASGFMHITNAISDTSLFYRAAGAF